MELKLKQYKKVAIVHDILYEFGGAEVVLDQLLQLFPEADVYTFFFNKNNKTIKKKFKMRIRSSFFSRISLLHILGKYISVLKLVSWIYFLSLDLDKYNFVISSSHSFNSKIVRTKPKIKHVSYIHTPPKYLYGFTNELSFLQHPVIQALFFSVFWLMKKIDFFAAQQPDLLISNSKEVSQRIRQIYKRQSTIIYPPVAFPKKAERSDQLFYIAHSRLVRQKGIELIVRTCTRFNIPLVVIGTGYQEQFLHTIAGKTVFFTGFITREQITALYKHAKALLYAARDEDFGIVPVESQGHGVPVIAYKSGGVRETVRNTITGVFFNEYSIISLKKAIDTFEQLNINPENCRKNAKKFTIDSFRKNFSKLII